MVKISGELGPLERAVMDYLWDRGEAATVRQVFDAIGSRRDLAYTTVMTVMDRLWRKKLLSRGQLGRAYVYRARGSREDHTALLVRKVLAGAKDRRSVLLGFVQAVNQDDLLELERLIRTAQRERGARRR